MLIAMHNIRTPLTRIRWGTERLLDAPNESQQVLTEIKHASEQLVMLTNRFLDTTQITANYADYRRRFKSLDLRSLVEKTIPPYGKRAREKGIAFKSALEAVPMISADGDSLSSVMETMLDNAIRYTNSGGTIWVNLRNQGRHIEFSVQDTGIGISSADLPHVSTSFFRSRNALAAQTEGLGLGLSFAQSLIRQHKGEITVASPGENQGTTVAFRIPIS